MKDNFYSFVDKKIWISFVLLFLCVNLTVVFCLSFLSLTHAYRALHPTGPPSVDVLKARIRACARSATHERRLSDDEMILWRRRGRGLFECRLANGLFVLFV